MDAIFKHEEIIEKGNPFASASKGAKAFAEALEALKTGTEPAVDAINKIKTALVAMHNEMGAGTNYKQMRKDIEAIAKAQKQITAETKRVSAAKAAEHDIEARLAAGKERLSKLRKAAAHEDARQASTVEFLANQYKKQIAELGKISGITQQVTKDTTKLNMENAERMRVLKEQIKIEAAAKGSMDALSLQLGVMRKQFRALSEADREGLKGRAMQADIAALDAQIKALDAGIGNHQRNVGDYKQALLGLGDIVTGGLISGGITALAEAAIQSAAALAEATFEADRLKGTIGALYGVSGPSLEQMTEDTQVFASVWKKDVNEVVEATNALAKNMGISGADAMEILDKGMASGADVRGNFLEQISEYAPQFDRAGLSAENMVAILSQTEKMGIYSDKAPDMIKEAMLAITEMTPATRTAVEGLGFSADDMLASIKDGSLTVFEAMQQVAAKMESLPSDSQAVAVGLADIFKGAGEDGFGLISQLDTLKIELAELPSTLTPMQQAQQRLAESSARSMAELTRKLEPMFTAAMDFAADVLENTKPIFSVFEGLWGLFVELWESLKGVISSYYDLATGGQALEEGTFGVREAMEGLGKMLDWLSWPLKLTLRAVTDLLDGLKAFYDAILGIRDATVEWLESNESTNAALEKLREAWGWLVGQIQYATRAVTEFFGVMSESEPTEGMRNFGAAVEDAAASFDDLFARASGGEDVSAGIFSLRDQFEALEEAGRKSGAAGVAENVLAPLRERLLLLQEINLQNKRNAEDEEDEENEGGGGGGGGGVVASVEKNIVENAKPRERMSKDQFSRLEDLRLEAMAEGIEREMAMLAAKHEEILAEYERSGIDTSALERRLADERNAIRREYAERELAEKQAALDAGLEMDEAVFEAEILAMQRAGAAAEDIEKARTAFELEQAKKRLDFILQTGAFRTEAEIQQAKNLVEALQQEMDGLGEGGEGGSIMDFVKENAKAFVDFATEQFNALADAKIEAAAADVEAADRSIETLQNQLDSEIAIQQQRLEAGAAFDHEKANALQESMAQEQAVREKALQEQRAWQKRKDALARVEQAVSIGTAIANVLKDYSSIPFVGLALGGAAVALLLQRFASFKADAVKITARKGLNLALDKGEKHEQGGVNLGFIEAEKGERVGIFSAAAERSYGGLTGALVDAANKGNLLEFISAASVPVLAGFDGSGALLDKFGELLGISRAQVDAIRAMPAYLRGKDGGIVRIVGGRAEYGWH